MRKFVNLGDLQLAARKPDRRHNYDHGVDRKGPKTKWIRPIHHYDRQSDRADNRDEQRQPDREDDREEVDRR